MGRTVTQPRRGPAAFPLVNSKLHSDFQLETHSATQRRIYYLYIYIFFKKSTCIFVFPENKGT